MRTTLLLVDDHPVFRQGLRRLLEKEKDLKVVGEAGDGEAALEMVGKLSPDLVVMDITMPNLDGIEATRRILAAFPATKVVALSVHSRERFVGEMLRAGAAGYILKESVPEEMIQGIRTVLAGDVYLSASISGIVVSEYKKLLSDAEHPAETPSEPILRTKLHRPPVSADIIPRPRLIEQLEEGRQRVMTLISAPAGYGKSIVASQWLEACGCPNGWVSLDEGDSDLRVFLTYLLAAVQEAFPKTRLQSKSLLQAAGLPPVKVLARYLLNDLDEVAEPFILVLDDYHRISPAAVHDLLTELLRQPTPMLHLALLTRRDPPLPIGPLRARGLLTELTAEQLRFTPAETTAFLERVLRVSIDEKTAAALEARMEGWVTGLRLAALSLGRKEDVGRVLRGLKGDTPYVTDYLIREVLSAAPPAMVRYLTATSILDRFCASLCDELSLSTEEQKKAKDPLSGEAFIDWLEETHLFVIPLDEQHRWFRYHHLFQELLQNQLKQQTTPEDIATLHSQASAWFEAEGLVDEALEHALAAEDIERASEIVERNWRTVMNEGKWYVVKKWLSHLPDSVVQERPQLLLVLAWRHFYYLDVAAIPPVMDRIEKLVENDADMPDFSAEIAMFRGYVAYLLNEGARSLKQIEYALERIPMADVEFRSQSEILFGLAGHMEGQLERVTGEVEAWLRGPAPLTPLRESCLLWTLVFTHYMAGELQVVARENPRLRKAAASGGIDNFLAWYDYLDGLVDLQRGNLETAILRLEKAGERRYQHFTRAAADASGALAVAYQANGQPDQAETTLRSLVEFSSYLGQPFEQLADACMARVALMADRMEPALDWLKVTEPSVAAGMMSWFIQPCVIRCRALVAEGSAAGLAEAEERLREYAEMNETYHNSVQLIGILNQLAIACERQDKRDEARSALERAITLARPGGFIFPFLELGPPMADLLKRLQEQNIAVDYVEKLLAAFANFAFGSDDVTFESEALTPIQNQKSKIENPLLEPLTNRELDVLELLAQRLQTKEIAERLFISHETVKGHLKNIYQKLGVGNRREAVERARNLGIL